MADDCPKCEEGLPPWMGTFADLMSLLMCFFVLLLSFAQIDAVRFKKMAESMKDAFGVQREIPANEIVKGVSVIKQEWSPTIADPDIISEIRQETSDSEKEYIKMHDQSDGQSALDGQGQGGVDDAQAMQQAREAVEQQLAEQFAQLQEALEKEIGQGLVELEREESKIIVRIREKGSFASGSARLDPGFDAVMDRISEVLAARPGRILVVGHTDNVPIKTGRFRSNWELSSARAVTVLHSLLRNKSVREDRVAVQGLADTHPLAKNDSAENRAKNRRVELILIRGRDENGTDIGVTDGAGP